MVMVDAAKDRGLAFSRKPKLSAVRKARA